MKQKRDKKTGRFLPVTQQICIHCGGDLKKVERMPKSWGRVCRKCGRKKRMESYKRDQRWLGKHVGNRCVFCGSIDIDYHHVVPIWNHARSHLKKNKRIIFPLCRACHTTWHNIKKELEIPIM